MTQPFYGYAGRVWSVVLAAYGYFSQVVGSSSNPTQTLGLADVVLETCLNGIACINANRVSTAWINETAVLAQIQSLPFVATPTDTGYYNRRLAAMQAAGPALAALAVLPLSINVPALLAKGTPAIPYPGVLEFFSAFAYETAPAGLTLTNLPATASQNATAFSDIAALIAIIEGSITDNSYDICARFALEMSAFAEMLGEYTLGFSTTPLPQLWNQMFVLPTMLMHADLILGAPKDLTTQQEMLIRYLILSIVNQISLFVMTLARPVATKVEQATVLVGDSLMNIAARSLGDFERWVDIANFNGLEPPYIGAAASAGIATWGSKLMLPVTGAQKSGLAQPLNPAGLGSANYLYNFLGVDYYFGPLNGDMPTWTGDFQLIAGYPNLRLALGRRLQTALGTLIYHPDYGSRIPPEIGNVQIKDEAAYIAAFGKACLLSDPRVLAVPSATATLLPNFAIGFEASVQPGGFGSSPLSVNEVINSAIAPASITQS